MGTSEDFYFADFAVVDFFAAGFSAFLASTFTPRDLARATRADLRREAVFFFMRSFFTALSYSDWTF